MNFEALAQIAAKAALEAGKVIQQFKDDAIQVQHKEGGMSYASQVVTKVDIACEKVILKHLIPTCKKYPIALLSEETPDDGSRHIKDYFWCVDPLDGTLAFIKKQPGFSVSIALVAKDGTPIIGVVYDPITDNLYTAIKDKSVFKNGQPWEVKSQNSYLTYFTDKKLADTPNHTTIQKILEAKAKSFGLSTIKEMSGGGAVLNAIWVAENSPAMFLKQPKKEKGGGSIWDFAATACIFNELGLQATDYFGKPLQLNPKETTFMNTQGVSYRS